MENKGKEIDLGFRINFSGSMKFVRNPEVSRGAKALLFDILFYAGTDGMGFPSQQKLSADLGVSTRQIRFDLAELKRSKVLFWERGGSGSSNRYTFSEEIYFLYENSKRKRVSEDSGKGLPIQVGNQFPPKVFNESNQLSSSQLLLLFEELNKSPISKFDKDRFLSLCDQFPFELVKRAIEIAKTRNKQKINAGYLSIIIRELQKFGEPPPKPVFHPCGKCDKGYNLGEDSVYHECDCHAEYEQSLEDWVSGKGISQ
jgi:hypothetical protein